MSSLSVVKVGGSLFDLPDLGPRLAAWIAQTSLSTVLMVPGGGSATDVVRELDRQHGLGEEAAHWLALRALTVNAYFLAHLLPRSKVVSDPGAVSGDQWAILDCYAFACTDDDKPDHLPHSWSVTSDSIAARAAKVAQARQLFLLKSLTIPETIDWHEAARLEWVDAFFPEAVGALTVTTVNFRAFRSE